jgi:hypothetical protein
LRGRYSSSTRFKPHLARACCSARTPILSIWVMAFFQGVWAWKKGSFLRASLARLMSTGLSGWVASSSLWLCRPQRCKLPGRLSVRRADRQHFFTSQGPEAPTRIKSTTGELYGQARTTPKQALRA